MHIYISLHPSYSLWENSFSFLKDTQAQSDHGENFGFSTLLSFPHHPCWSDVLRCGLYGSEKQFCKHWRAHWSILLSCFSNWWVLWHFSLIIFVTLHSISYWPLFATSIIWGLLEVNSLCCCISCRIFWSVWHSGQERGNHF